MARLPGARALVEGVVRLWMRMVRDPRGRRRRGPAEASRELSICPTNAGAGVRGGQRRELFER